MVSPSRVGVHMALAEGETIFKHNSFGGVYLILKGLVLISTLRQKRNNKIQTLSDLMARNGLGRVRFLLPKGIGLADLVCKTLRQTEDNAALEQSVSSASARAVLWRIESS